MSQVIQKENTPMDYSLYTGENGNEKHSAVRLGCTARTIYRFIISYKKVRTVAFSHKNKCRSPSTKYKSSFKREIIQGIRLLSSIVL